MVRIRLQRVGTKKRPFYRVVAVDKRVKRDGKFIEILGQYQPLNPEDKQINLKQERVQYWLKNGAQPSDTTRAILKRSGLFPS